MVTLINPPSRLHYLRNLRSPANLGLGCDCPNYKSLGGYKSLRGLGDSALCPSVIKSQLDDLAAKVQAAQQDLQATGQQVLQASQSGVDMAEAGQLVANQQKDLNTMRTSLDYAYRTFCGTVAPGLSALGVIPAIPLGTAAVVIASVAAALAAWWIYEQTLKDKVNQSLANAKGQQQNNIAFAQQQLADAIARGDAAAQQAWQKVIDDAAATSTNLPGGVGDWFAANWPWLAVAGVGIFALREVF